MEKANPNSPPGDQKQKAAASFSVEAVLDLDSKKDESGDKGDKILC